MDDLDRLELHYRLEGLKCLREHVERFEFAHGARGTTKLPRGTDWRPYRFAIQDVVFGYMVMRHARECNALVLDVFLTAEIEGYPPGSGAKALTLMALTEAFRVGASMSLQFTPNVEDGHVPSALFELALAHGVPLTRADEGVVTSTEGRRLYASLTGFPNSLLSRVRDLEARGLLSTERACYMIHHGVWTMPEVEGIVAGSPYPDLILSGEVAPEDYHLYRHVQGHCRAAILGGHLDRALAQRQDSGHETGRDGEDDERNLTISFEAEPYARRYRCEDESVPIPAWETDGGPGELPRSRDLLALLRPREAVDLDLALEADLDAAAVLRSSADVVAVVVPFDFHDLPAERRDRLRAISADRGVLLLICPETTRALDAELARKLARSRVLRD